MERTSYTCTLDADKVEQLKAYLQDRGYEFREVAHAHFGAASRTDKVNISAYHSGKLVIQGKGTTDFVQFVLEPQILQEVKMGYEHVLDPTMLEPRIGVDESGKGDYFGPLVVAAVYVDESVVWELKERGIRDSKQVSSDARIAALAKEIRSIPGCKADVVPIGPAAYNSLQKKMGNVNTVLGWGHARVIENMLGKVSCGKAISDQFGNKTIIKRALMDRGKKIDLVQRHKAESDLAVAAASIIARDEFVRRLKILGKKYRVNLPKGASKAVIEAGQELVRLHGPEILSQVAKTHFRTTQKVLQETNK